MIEIQLVKVNGVLIGRRFQDRWNLDMMGIQSIPYCPNQAFIKKLRRFAAIEGFTYRSIKGGEMEGPTMADRALFSPTVHSYGKVA